MMSDCSRCWETPCCCGWDYRHNDVEYLERMKVIFERAAQFKKEHPNAVFSSWIDKYTDDDMAYIKFVSGGR